MRRPVVQDSVAVKHANLSSPSLVKCPRTCDEVAQIAGSLSKGNTSTYLRSHEYRPDQNAGNT